LVRPILKRKAFERQLNSQNEDHVTIHKSYIFIRKWLFSERLPGNRSLLSGSCENGYVAK
jgi:hypothetical protein